MAGRIVFKQKSSRSSNRELSCYAIRALTEAGLLFPRFFDGSLSGGQTGDGNIAPSDNKNQGGIPDIRGLSYIQKSILPFYVKGRILLLREESMGRTGKNNSGILRLLLFSLIHSLALGFALLPRFIRRLQIGDEITATLL